MDNPPAFPNTGNSTWSLHPAEGMTLRDWFAGQVLPECHAMSHGTEYGKHDRRHIPLAVARAYEIADAMLAKRAAQEQ